MTVEGGSLSSSSNWTLVSGIEHHLINLANSLAVFCHCFSEFVRAGEPTANRDTVKRSGVRRQDGFAFKTPASQNAFDPPQRAKIIDEFGPIPLGKHALLSSSLQRAKSVWLQPSVLQRKNLRDKFSVDRSARTGFDCNLVLANRCSPLFNSQAHVGDLLFPI